MNNAETCTGITDATGTASCPITPGELAGTYTLAGTFAGDTSTALPLPLLGSTSSSSFVVALEETGLAYTGQTHGLQLPEPDRLGCSDHAKRLGGSAPTPIAGRTLTFVLGSGPTAQTCSTTSTAPTDSTGTASCIISNVNQTQGPVPLTATFTSDGYYQTATAPATINVGPVQTGTTLSVANATSDYSDATTVSGDPDRPVHRPARGQRAGDVHAERYPTVRTGDDERQRGGVVPDHAERAGWHATR